MNKAVKHATAARMANRRSNGIAPFVVGSVRKKSATNKQQAAVRKKINTGDHNLILLYFMPYPQLYYGLTQRQVNFTHFFTVVALVRIN